jgi:hypothetical protein
VLQNYIHTTTPVSLSTVESGQSLQSLVKLRAIFDAESKSNTTQISGFLQMTDMVHSNIPFICGKSRERNPTSHLLIIGDSHAGQYLRSIDR